MIISRSFLLKMANVLDTIVQKMKTYILHSIYFFSESRGIYEIMYFHCYTVHVVELLN